MHPTDAYIKKVFDEMDIDGDGFISHKDFFEIFNNDVGIYRWFEYLNLNEQSLKSGMKLLLPTSTFDEQKY